MIKLFITSFILLFFTHLYPQVIMENIHIIPEPQKVIYKGKEFKLNSNTKLVFNNFKEKSDFFRKILTEEILNNHSIKLNFEISASAPKENYILFADLEDISDIENKKLASEYKIVENEEAYLLDISEKSVKIFANNAKGAFYGLMSLFQLIENKKTKLSLPCVSIVDFPLLPMRGISDDMSRGQVSTIEDLKKIVKFCARYKMNFYSPYIEDIFEFEKYPDIGLNRGRITKAEARELVKFAADYFVDIIPIFEMLGHMENILIQPAYYHLADFPGSASFDPTNEKTYEFLDDCVKELVEVFPSQYFNAGLDESWDVGFGNSKSLKEKEGIAVLHANHYKRVNDILKKYGKKMMMYGDIIHNHPEIFELLPKDIIVIDWRYGVYNYEKFVRKYYEYGIPFFASPSVTNFNRIFPWIENSIVNIKEFVKAAIKYGCNGFLNSNWGDNGGENFREYNWFGYAFGAECSWNVMNTDVEKFKVKFFKDFYNSNIEDFIVIYRLLSDFGLSTSQQELWRDPFLPKRDNSLDNSMPMNLRAESMRSKAVAVKKLLDRIKPTGVRNYYHIDFLKFATFQGEFVADKLLLIDEIKNSVDEKKGNLTEEERNDLIKKVEALISKINVMKDEFIRLWKLTNKSDNLNLIIENKYNRQIAYWNEFIFKLKSTDKISYDNRIKSNWIYHPEANPREKDGKSVPKATFNKKIILPDKPEICKLQLIGDSFAELYVNGKLVGDVRARNTLSLFVESQRIKIFDITNYLIKGENDIKIRCQNYGTNPTAKVNVQIYVKNGDNEYKIYSDQSWLVSKDEKEYVNSSVLPDRGNINEPNFKINLQSWIEK